MTAADQGGDGPIGRPREGDSVGVACTAEALVSQGLLLAGQGQLLEAIALLRRAVHRRPDWPVAHHNLGVALAQVGQREEAARSLEEALRLRPNYADACYNLGGVLRELGRTEEAVSRFRQAVRLRPEHAGAFNNLGLALTEAGRPGEAVGLLRKALALEPAMKEAHNNLGLALAELGRFAEAEACYHEALRLDAEYVEAHTNLASACKGRGRLEEALACYQWALWLEPDSAIAHYNRALTWLQAGDYERGWPEYEWRWRRRQARPRPFRQPRWDGGPREGRTLFVWLEQGLGDVIHFLRYASLVQQRGGRVLLECPARLRPLLATCAEIDGLVGEKDAAPDFDVQAPLLSLPGLLKTTAPVPVEGPYLRAEPARVESWRRRLEGVGAFRVGVVWQGNPRFQWDRHRSFPLACLAPLAAVPGVRLVSLQKGPGVEQVTALKGAFEVLELGEELDRDAAFVDTAAVMKGLNLVVTADTAAAHLAGALGVPVWVALSQVADWRWGLGREDTPWYPTMRLFRQARLGDWAALFRRMAGELRREAARRAP